MGNNLEQRVRRLEQQLGRPDYIHVRQINLVGPGFPNRDYVLSYDEYVAEFAREPSNEPLIRLIYIGGVDRSAHGEDP